VNIFLSGKILLWPWHWRTVPLCPKHPSLFKYVHVTSLLEFLILLLQYKLYFFSESTSCISLVHNVTQLLDVGNKAVGIMKPGQTFTIEPMINAGKSTYDTCTFQRFNCTVQECFSFPDST
jgi:hypothetical protein